MDVWQEALNHLEQRLGTQNFETWIKPLKMKVVQSGHITLEVPNKFFRDWLIEHFLTTIQNTLSNPCIWAIAQHLVADSVNQVCFSKSNPAVDEERIVISSGLVGYSFRGGMGKLVAGADYKAIKCVFCNKTCNSGSSLCWPVNPSLWFTILL